MALVAALSWGQSSVSSERSASNQVLMDEHFGPLPATSDQSIALQHPALAPDSQILPPQPATLTDLADSTEGAKRSSGNSVLLVLGGATFLALGVGAVHGARYWADKAIPYRPFGRRKAW